MATSTTRTDIIELVVLATGGAPGTTQLAKLVSASDGGSTLSEIAATLTSSAAFTSKYPAFQTPAEFAAEFLDVIVPGWTAAQKAEGVTVIRPYKWRHESR